MGEYEQVLLRYPQRPRRPCPYRLAFRTDHQEAGNHPLYLQEAGGCHPCSDEFSFHEGGVYQDIAAMRPRASFHSCQQRPEMGPE